MGRYGVKLPDVGEGVAEAELIAWHVAVGDSVTNATVLAEVMTDKATVEISSPVAGTVQELLGQPGDTLAVGAEFVVLDTTSPDQPPSANSSSRTDPTPPANSSSRTDPTPPANLGSRGGAHGRAVAAPAVRARAAELGIDLATVAGSGPEGRVLHADLDRVLLGRSGGTGPVGPPLEQRSDEPRVQQVIGLRRRISDRLSQAWREIPHITYVEEVDVTDLEARRAELNAGGGDRPRLTILPFLGRAIVVAVSEQPALNAHYDGPNERLSLFDAVHLGIATQTDDGLMVPVVRHAEARGLHDLAAEIARVSGAARNRTATSAELSGSTISITSLGAMGGISTTPIINQPEVAIVGVNKIATRPVWRVDRFEPRQVMNLSCSFDHRIVDGWDAATFVQRLKALLERPAGL